MKFFLDTTDINELRELMDAGLVDGVTTNPSLIAKSGKNFQEVLLEICRVVRGPVSAEVTAVNAELMVKEGKALCKIADNIVVKIPSTWEGIKACNSLSRAGVKTNMTLCFSASQALLAAKAGATYVSPFVGRHDDYGRDGLELISDIVMIYNQYEQITTEVLVASVRNPAHVVAAAKMGADIITVAPAILRQLVEHPFTEKGLENFLADWEKTGQKIII